MELPKVGGMSQLQVERSWITDRETLVVCGQRHRAVVDYYRGRDEVLEGFNP